MNYIQESISKYSSFYYEFSFRVTKENYIDRILKFDEIFLKAGLKFGIFIFEGINNFKDIENYLYSRRQSFFKDSESYHLLRVLDLTQWKDHNGYPTNSILIPYYSIDEIGDFKLKLSNSGCELLNYDSSYNLTINEVITKQWEEREFDLSISSNSSIWWNDVLINNDEVSQNESKKKLSLSCSNTYELVSRFNSFLREIKGVTEKLDGTFLLEDYNSKHVTENGILINGELLFDQDLV